MGQLNQNLTLDGSSDFSTLSQDISDAIGEINRQADELDKLDRGIKITARGVVTLTPSGSSYPAQTLTLNQGLASSFIAFMLRSDQPTKLYQVPYLETAGGVGSLTAKLLAQAFVDQNSITFAADVVTGYGTLPILNFFYYMIQQPANPATT